MSTFLQDSMLKKDLKHSLVKLGMLLVHMTYPMRYFWRFKLAAMLDAADWYFQAFNIAVLHVMTMTSIAGPSFVFEAIAAKASFSCCSITSKVEPL